MALNEVIMIICKGNKIRKGELNEDTKFWRVLTKKREEKQITLRSMVDMLKVSAPYLSDVEKSRRNPPEYEKLMQISRILMFSEEEKSLMLDLAGKIRNSVAPNLPEHIMERDYVYSTSLFSHSEVISQ